MLPPTTTTQGAAHSFLACHVQVSYSQDWRQSPFVHCLQFASAITSSIARNGKARPSLRAETLQCHIGRVRNTSGFRRLAAWWSGWAACANVRPAAPPAAGAELPCHSQTPTRDYQRSSNTCALTFKPRSGQPATTPLSFEKYAVNQKPPHTRASGKGACCHQANTRTRAQGRCTVLASFFKHEGSFRFGHKQGANVQMTIISSAQGQLLYCPQSRRRPQRCAPVRARARAGAGLLALHALQQRSQLAQLLAP